MRNGRDILFSSADVRATRDNTSEGIAYLEELNLIGLHTT